MQKHRITKLTRGLRLALAVGAVAATSTPAVFAQEGADNTEVIEIRGIRASQKENINTKRFSDSVVDAITAEDIGKFPDKNVAESLSRIPGITIDRDFGEGQGVVTQGRLLSDGTFRAEQVLAKHDETYMPPEVDDALEKAKKMGLQ